MRVSTGQIFSSGTLGIQGNQQDLYKLQSQLSTGRRLLTPEDDPVSAAQALVVSQSKSLNSQYIENQGAATTQLASVEGQLSVVTQLLQNVRERVVQAGNTTLTNADRASIATEIEARLSELLGIANAQDGAGQYLFSGYRGSTLPFSSDAAGQIQYFGDDGERALQVSDSRQMPVSVSGSSLFMRPSSGNGTFVTSVGGNQAVVGTTSGINQGSAVIDAGSVTDPALWASATNPGNLMIRFSVAAGATSYVLYDNTNPLLPVALTAATPFVPGQTIPFSKTMAPAASYGGQVTVTGQPADGDTFTIARSSSQSIFETFQNIATALRSPVGAPSYSTTEFVNRLASELTNIDRAFDNLGKITATIGSRLLEIDSLGDAASDVALQYDQRLSSLQDLDYADAISDFTKKQVQLEAAQKTFAQVSRLSLFDIL